MCVPALSIFPPIIFLRFYEFDVPLLAHVASFTPLELHGFLKLHYVLCQNKLEIFFDSFDSKG